MEDRFQHTINGQSVLQADLNGIGETASLADDRVLAELLRLAPYDGSTVSRGVIPYGHAASGAAGLVGPNGASGSVLVRPFRAVIGSRTAVGTDAKKNWRDIRSAVGVGTTTLAQPVSFSANSSGNPRWDLVYAAVAVDANTAAVSRKKKDPASKIISAVNVVTRLQTTVTLGVKPGTPAGSPLVPAIDADAGGVYYIPLAYVRIPSGFTASSTVLDSDICVCAPCLTVTAPGSASIQVADQQHLLGGTVMPAPSAMQFWGSFGVRPELFLPPTMVGGTSLVLAMSLRNSTPSHANTAVVDSRDWRGRLCRFSMQVRPCTSDASDPLFAWNQTDPTKERTPNAAGQNGTSSYKHILHGFGQTLTAEDYSVIFGTATPNAAFVALAREVDIGSAFPDDAAFGIYCDLNDGGKLKVRYTTSTGPHCRVFCWLDFTAPMEPI